jgi:hypothetical protein
VNTSAEEGKLNNYGKTFLDKKELFFVGNETLLQKKKVGIFISRAIPLNIIIPAEKFLLSISELAYVFISGWHSPFEKRILKKLLAQGKEAIFFTSKGINNQAQYKYLAKALSNERLLIVSLMEDKTTVTLRNSIVRNEAIAEIADYNLFIFINRDGNLEKLFNKLLNQNKTPLIFNHPANAVFLKKGNPIGLDNLNPLIKSADSKVIEEMPL